MNLVAVGPHWKSDAIEASEYKAIQDGFRFLVIRSGDPSVATVIEWVARACRAKISYEILNVSVIRCLS